MVLSRQGNFSDSLACSKAERPIRDGYGCIGSLQHHCQCPPGPHTDERTDLRNASGGGAAAGVPSGDRSSGGGFRYFWHRADFRESLAPLSALLPAHERTPLGHTNTEALRKTFCWTLSRYTVSDLVLRTRARKRNTLRISSRWEKMTWAALELHTSEFCATN